MSEKVFISSDHLQAHSTSFCCVKVLLGYCVCKLFYTAFCCITGLLCCHICRLVPHLAATIWCIYSFLIGVVLLTLLVAIMTDTYYRIKSSEEAEVGVKEYPGKSTQSAGSSNWIR